jgi:pyrrolidone-carboxylate peptidase
MSSKNIFISSFGLFGSYAANSGEQVMKALRGKRDPSGRFWFYGDTFPATIPAYDRGAHVFDMAREYRASGIIALGMASDKHVPTIERAAHNQNDSHYCTPEANYREVDGNESCLNRVGVDLSPWNTDRFMAESCQAGLPKPGISGDAGGFCCNHLIYQMWLAQHREQSSGRIPWIFLHLPCTPEAVPDALNEEFALKGKVRTPVEVLVNYLHLLVATAELPEAEELYPSEVAAV